MLDRVKVLTDEQTRQSLQRLRDDFAEILAPLEKLDSVSESLSDLAERSEELESSIGGKINDLADNISAIKKKTTEILDIQQECLNKTNSVHSEIIEFKNALNAINWED